MEPIAQACKEPSNLADHKPALKLAVAYFCRFIADRTPILASVDAVASIPANPGRFSQRMMSLPDELAKGVQHYLGVPFLFDALSSNVTEVELKKLPWAKRKRAVCGLMRSGDITIARDRNLLLVDDITTSGATVREASRLLRDAGATSVLAVTLCHTEG